MTDRGAPRQGGLGAACAAALLRSFVALSCALACASTPPAPLLEGAERVAILSGGPPPSPDLRARGRGESALRGAGSGVLEAVAPCSNTGGEGDFAALGVILCLGLATMIGGIGGGMVGVLEGLPADAVRGLNAELDEHLRDEDLQSQFIEILSDRIARVRETTQEDPDLVLWVRLRQVRLAQHPDRKLSLELAARVELEFPRLVSDGRRYERAYRFEGTSRHVDRWLEDEGAGVVKQLREAFGGLADEVVRDLWGRQSGLR